MTRLIYTYLLLAVLVLQSYCEGICQHYLRTQCENANTLASNTIDEATINNALEPDIERCVPGQCNYETWKIILESTDTIFANVSTSSMPLLILSDLDTGRIRSNRICNCTTQTANLNVNNCTATLDAGTYYLSITEINEEINESTISVEWGFE